MLNLQNMKTENRRCTKYAAFHLESPWQTDVILFEFQRIQFKKKNSIYKIVCCYQERNFSKSTKSNSNPLSLAKQRLTFNFKFPGIKKHFCDVGGNTFESSDVIYFTSLYFEEKKKMISRKK